MRFTTTFGPLIVTLVAGLACSNSSSSGSGGEADARSPEPPSDNHSSNADKENSAMKIESAAFDEKATIPKKYTCEGEDISPPLSWSGVPEGAKSLALIVDDPDAPDPAAPTRTWVHWVLYDMPPSMSELPEDGSPEALPSAARQGQNDWERTGYGGPCPPVGEHRYVFKLYALDTKLGDLDEPTAKELVKAMEGHILAETQLVGVYEKQDEG